MVSSVSESTSESDLPEYQDYVDYSYKARRYQYFIIVNNIFLVLGSVALLYIGTILTLTYHLTKLGFWSIYFEILPFYLIILGVIIIIVGLYGFFIIRKGNPLLLTILSLLFILTAILQSASIFIALQVKSDIYENPKSYEVQQNMAQYGTSSIIANNWDTMQRNLHCCGGYGYKYWFHVDIYGTTGHSVRLGSNQIAEVEFNGQWVPICGHYFWDNNVGANLFCQQLGYPSGKIEKRLKLPCDGLQVGRCNEGDNWLQCSHPKCNQLIIGGQCNNSPAMCTKGENAAFSIHCDGSGTSVPKSCCKDNNLEYVDCGENIFYERPNEIRRRIFTTGCIEKLKKMLRDDSFIYWLMIAYAILSLFMVISQLLTIILTFCYISLIRYVQEESQFQTVFSSDL